MIGCSIPVLVRLEATLVLAIGCLIPFILLAVGAALGSYLGADRGGYWGAGQGSPPGCFWLAWRSWFWTGSATANEGATYRSCGANCRPFGVLAGCAQGLGDHDGVVLTGRWHG